MEADYREELKGRTRFPKATALLIVAVALILALARTAGSVIVPQRSTIALTGVLTDSLCGGDHGTKSAGNPECTRSCVELGAQYALLVGKMKVSRKLYILQGHYSALERFAGMEVQIKGRQLGRDTIVVDQVDSSYAEGAGN